jgi:hypothetical protein
MNLKNIQQYLPSKKFQKTIVAFLVLVIVIFIVIFIISSQKEKYSSQTGLAVNNKTVYELLGKDTDGDGVEDWEEQFWGTDKNKKFTFEGISDSQYIDNKRLALNTEQELNTKTLTETDIFAREFFPAILALNSEGVDQETINNFSNALGQKIVTPEIKITYFDSDIKTNQEEDIESKKDYYTKIQKLFNKYKESGIGDELQIISAGLLSYSNQGKTTDTNELLVIGQAYQDFAKSVVATEVPSSLSEYHLRIANNAHNTGASVLNMAKVIEDPIVGLSALSSYQKYSQDLIDTVDELEVELE